MKEKLVSSVLILVIGLLCFYAGYTVKGNIVNTITTTEYVVDSIKYTDTITLNKTKLTYQVIDSTKHINLDSLRAVLYKEAEDYWNNILPNPQEVYGLYVAEFDTSIITSDYRLYSVISYSSPIPLHPKSYFTNSIDIEYIQTINTTNNCKVFPSITFGLSVGYGYGVFSRTNDLFIGAGLSIGLAY
jgi:hypothetical protein